MSINLKEIDPNTKQSIKHEIMDLDSDSKFVAPNWWSIDEYEYKMDQSRSFMVGIYLDDKLIGFSMVSHEENILCLKRLMIDKNYQKKGYGTKALSLVIDKSFDKYPSYKEMFISTSNPHALRMYQKFGFELTNRKLKFDTPYGLIVESELLYTKP